MVVRGAPAIAIAAAISLAVEVCDLDFSGTSLDSAHFLCEKLDYLVSRFMCNFTFYLFKMFFYMLITYRCF